MAIALYRAITEKHAFYSCETVGSDVTKQFIRDFKVNFFCNEFASNRNVFCHQFDNNRYLFPGCSYQGTIASMFNVDTKLGRLYVFDIQRTYREVYDHARRILHAKGMDVASTPQLVDQHTKDDNVSDIDNSVDIQDRMEKEIAERISEAITCRICMDQVINTSFTPCGHIASCYSCAEKYVPLTRLLATVFFLLIRIVLVFIRCETCPLCRTTITCISRIYLPVELHSSA